MADEPYEVTVQAAFDEDGTWCIDARVSYRDGEPAVGTDPLGEARLALLVGIAHEAVRGRTLGATKARLYLREGDRLNVLDPEQVTERWGSIQ